MVALRLDQRPNGYLNASMILANLEKERKALVLAIRHVQTSNIRIQEHPKRLIVAEIPIVWHDSVHSPLF